MTMTSEPCQKQVCAALGSGSKSLVAAPGIVECRASGFLPFVDAVMPCSERERERPLFRKVGYGDVLPYTPAEYLVCTSCLALGVT